MTPDVPPLLDAQHIRVQFPTSEGPLRAVDGVSLHVAAGDTVALVGESGCGKSTLARALIQLEPLRGGEIRVDGLQVNQGTNRRWLSRQVQIVFQDPEASLNPHMSIAQAVAEPLKIHRLAQPNRQQRVDTLLKSVGIDPLLGARFPHELSGGQKQRVNIARALAVEPRLLICDESVSALDVSVQAQILNLLKHLQQTLGLAYLFITHDLSVVRYFADRVLVMYLGQVVEAGETQQVFDAPMHPYTQGLLSAIPEVSPTAPRRRERLRGEIPSPTRPPSGCRFHPRCAHASEQCSHAAPELARRQAASEPKPRLLSCHLYPLAGKPTADSDRR